MKKFIQLIIAASAVAFLSGCTGNVYNTERNCSYHYFLHPDVSISKMIGGCGPVGTHQ